MSLGVGFMSTQITPVMSQLMSTSLMSTYHSSRMFVIGNQNRKLRCMHLLCRKYVGTDPANLLWHEARYYWTNRLRVILKDFLIVFFLAQNRATASKKNFFKILAPECILTHSRYFVGVHSRNSECWHFKMVQRTSSCGSTRRRVFLTCDRWS